jgi:hypothetical protein
MLGVRNNNVPEFSQSLRRYTLFVISNQRVVAIVRSDEWANCRTQKHIAWKVQGTWVGNELGRQEAEHRRFHVGFEVAPQLPCPFPVLLRESRPDPKHENMVRANDGNLDYASNETINLIFVRDSAEVGISWS